MNKQLSDNHDWNRSLMELLIPRPQQYTFFYVITKIWEHKALSLRFNFKW